MSVRPPFAPIAAGLVLAACATPDSPSDAPAGTPGTDGSAAAVHARALTFDGHVHIGFREELYATAELDPGGFTTLQVDLPKMRAGGLDAVMLNLFADQRPLGPEGYAEAQAKVEAQFAAIDRMLRAYPNQIALARSADEVLEINASGRLVALLAMENGFPLGEDLDNLALWRDRGVSSVLITHRGHNQFGGSDTPLPDFGDAEADPGLTALGRDLVAALNDHGMIIDVSHAGPRTLAEIVAASRAPVIASHSGVRAIRDHRRNLADDQIRAIAARGGVVHVATVRGYLGEFSPEYLEARSALVAELNLDTPEGRNAATQETIDTYYRREAELPKLYGDITVSDMADHIDHIVDVAGIDHVGIGTDFDGGGGVGGWSNAAESQALTEELLRRGYSEAHIAKIWSGNFLRVMRAAEAAAR
jgi:membrane dipeptidase